ncbi:MAG: hypothetical protein IJJ33_10610, partial [Victivallales bacterium]|nr:hypothetical protein [Victivallales bacterium]
MMRRIFPLLFLGCLTLLSAPVLVGVSETGECLSLGSGWHGENARHAPVVADDGQVTFIAPDYKEAATQEEAKAFSAVYQAKVTDSIPKGSELYSGFDTLLYDFLCIIPPYPSRDAAGIRHFELTVCGDTFARLTREYKGGSNDSIFRSAYLKIGSLKGDFQQDGNISGLSVAGTGKLAIVHNTQTKSYQLFSLANNTLTAQNTTIPQGNGRACLNSDGTAIWLASTVGLAGKPAGPLRLYRYKLATKTTTYLADLQDTSETKFGLADAQLAAAANTEAVALVSNNAALWGGTPTVATVGRQ